ncbi:MAG: ExbD/TolR family protein [Nitrospinales bacterium]
MISLASSRRTRFKPNMASLIDVIFLLLIFFMLTFSVQGQGMDLRLPDGQPSETRAEPDLVVQLSRNNILRVNHQIVETDALLQELESRLKDRKQKVVVIEADKKIRYGFFARVLDIARQAGAEDFSIIR